MEEARSGGGSKNQVAGKSGAEEKTRKLRLVIIAQKILGTGTPLLMGDELVAVDLKSATLWCNEESGSGQLRTSPGLTAGAPEQLARLQALAWGLLWYDSGITTPAQDAQLDWGDVAKVNKRTSRCKSRHKACAIRRLLRLLTSTAAVRWPGRLR